MIHYGIYNRVQRASRTYKNRTQQLDTIDDPLAAVFEIKASMGIFATQEGSSHAS
jgi:hypothetical protein